MALHGVCHYAHYDHTPDPESAIPSVPNRGTRATLDDLRPLKPVELELLLALVDEERHGYALVQRIAEQTDGLLRLEPGNLYRVIKRLRGAGLIGESRGRSAGTNDERRRYYRLTPAGARVVDAELDRLRALLKSRAARELTQRVRTT